MLHRLMPRMRPLAMPGVVAAVVLAAAAAVAGAPPLPDPPMPADGAIRPVNIFGSDDRRLEERRPGTDFGRIVLISDPTTQKAGTGFLVAPCYAMSAMHVVLSDYDLNVRAYPSTAFEYMVYYGSGRRFGNFDDFTVGRPVAWGRYYDAVPVDASQDWILLQLERCVGERYGHFSPRPLALAEVAGRRLQLAGYPEPQNLFHVQVDPDCRVHEEHLWPLNRRPIWHHDCAVRQGASGAPMYFAEGGRSHVVAIAIGELQSTDDVLPAYETGRANIAVPIANAMPALQLLAEETPDRVAEAQDLLNALGRPAGPADGAAGPRTRRAVHAYRVARDLPGGALIDDDLLARLRADLTLLTGTDEAQP